MEPDLEPLAPMADAQPRRNEGNAASFVTRWSILVVKLVSSSEPAARYSRPGLLATNVQIGAAAGIAAFAKTRVRNDPDTAVLPKTGPSVLPSGDHSLSPAVQYLNLALKLSLQSDRFDAGTRVIASMRRDSFFDASAPVADNDSVEDARTETLPPPPHQSDAASAAASPTSRRNAPRSARKTECK